MLRLVGEVTEGKRFAEGARLHHLSARRQSRKRVPGTDTLNLHEHPHLSSTVPLPAADSTRNMGRTGVLQPTEEDLPGIAKCQSTAFGEKRCWALGETMDQYEKNCLVGLAPLCSLLPAPCSVLRTSCSFLLSSPSPYAYQNTNTKVCKEHPEKWKHIRVVKDDETGEVLGCCQLQLHGDVGMLDLPEDLRHKPEPKEAYVEWIGCTRTGCGIGTSLLRWASGFALENGCEEITLMVMKKNEGGIRLYERKGCELRSEKREMEGGVWGGGACLPSGRGVKGTVPAAERCGTRLFVVDLRDSHYHSKDMVSANPHPLVCEGPFIFCLMGCTYCSALWMVKPLTEADRVVDSDGVKIGAPKE